MGDNDGKAKVELSISTGRHPAGLHALCLCSLKSKERPESATGRDSDGLIDRGIFHVLSQVMEQHPTVYSRWAAHD